jgi:hypothetical protein
MLYIMKERTYNCCTSFEDNMAWLFGWLEGCITGCIFACSEDIDKDDHINMISEMFKGAVTGFKEGERLGHMDK